MEQLSLKSKVIWLTVFSIAMGFLETAVVVYLRYIYYPDGFEFPLTPMDNALVNTELFRELATMVMLLGIGVMASKKNIERFAFFIYSFAIWDIFYYVFLKVLLDWPASLMTWDVLFLIPVTWVGPVITPVLVSLTMILLAGVIVYYSMQLNNFALRKMEWMQLILGALVIFISFVYDYSSYILMNYDFHEIWSIQDKELFGLSKQYIPQYFNWWIFVVGELILINCIVRIYFRNKWVIRLTI